MLPPLLPSNEAARLDRLRSYGILDTESEASFDDLVRLAAFVCGTPISAVTLVDGDRQWFKSTFGLNFRETSREVSFCGHTVLAPEVLVVPDAHEDPRFVGNPLTLGPDGIRFYAGAPLVTPDGFALGALCVIDRTPRRLSAAQLEALEQIGRQVVSLLELRAANRRLQDVVDARDTALVSLRSSEDHVRAITESALDAITVADRHGKVVNWNAAAERLFGWPREEIVGRPLNVLMPEHLREAHDRGLVRLEQTGASRIIGRAIHTHGLRRDGTVFDLELSLGTWVSGRDRFFTGILRDVTETREAAEQITRERDFSAAILDATDSLIIVISPDGTIERFNRACERAVGYASDEVLGRKFEFLLPPDKVADAWAMLAMLAVGRPAVRYETPWRHQDGSLRIVSWSIVALGDASGGLGHVLATGLDVTEQRAAVAELDRQHAIMRSVLAHMGDAVVVTDAEGRYILHNDAVDRMLGRAAGDPQLDRWPDTAGVFEADRTTRIPPAQLPLARAVRGEHVEQLEVFARTPKHPGGRWHSITATPIRDASGRTVGAVSVARDVTERRSAEQQLANQAAELRDLAVRDELTGLHNRRGFVTRAEQHLAETQRPALLVFVDLDGMKQINDRFGHEQGDRALRDTATLLKAAFRDGDILARLGGDEFVALVVGGDEDAMPGIRARLDQAMCLVRAGRPYVLSMSLGATRYDPGCPCTLESLLASADEKMYADKQARRRRAASA